MSDTRTAPDVALEVRGLCLDARVGGRTAPVVRDLTFDVRGGEILGIVGESGSGKSMTALAVMGMLPAAVSVTSGEIRYRGRDLLATSAKQMTRLRGGEIGMIFQDPLAFLNPLMTVGRQIAEALELHGSSRRAAKARAVDLLRLVGVRSPEKRVDDYPHEFSGGMRQRVMIAIAVANDPALLIADEPTTALDVTVQAEILHLLSRLCDDLGAALVLITHDIGIVEDICDDALVMYAGAGVEYGTVYDVLATSRHPYTRELMAATPRMGPTGRSRLTTIPGQPPDALARPSGCAFHPRCSLATATCEEQEPPRADRGEQAPHLVACWLSERPLPPSPATPAAARRDAREQPQLLLDVDQVEIGYRRRSLWRRGDPELVVKGVSLQAHAGTCLGLVGESGSGKSTVAKAVVGMLPLRSGSITIDGLRWEHSDPTSRAVLRRTVQMVFQDPYQSLNPRQTIADVVAEPLVVHRLVEPGRRRARVEELMALVGLSRSLLDRYPYQLSGGQRQRVGIARALAMEPKLLIADEPVSALDVSVQAQIINLLADLRDELGIGYVVIAHDLSVVRYLCEDVAVMRTGEIVESGPVEQVFRSPRHPYTVTLLDAAAGTRRQAGDDRAPADTEQRGPQA